MLTEMYHALAELLHGLSAPLYLADCVPDDTAFPYLTADFSPAPVAGETGQLALTLWCHGETANADRFRLTEELLTRLPPRGLRLSLTSGTATLRTAGSVTFLHDREALGTKTCWTLRFYPAA